MFNNVFKLYMFIYFVSKASVRVAAEEVQEPDDHGGGGFAPVVSAARRIAVRRGKTEHDNSKRHKT